MSTVKVSHILSVALSPKPGSTTTLVIKATGENGNSNMSNVRLEAIVYKKPPADGIWEFNMIGEEPEIVDQIMTRVNAHTDWAVPDNAKGVRVSGAGNSIMAFIRREEALAVPPPSEIEILKAVAWVNTQPIQPTPGGTLHVEIDYNSTDHGFHRLQKAVPQGINPTILLLEITHSPELIFFPNPRHNSYTEGLTKPGEYASIDLIYRGKKVGSIDKIPIVS